MLDELGLVPALDFMAEGVSKRSGIHVVVQGGIQERLPPLSEIALYRSVQEALNNVTKHAKAKCVRIRLREERQDNKMKAIVCSVKDDGVGLKPGAARGLGLLGIRERIQALGGSFDINSHAGLGTELLFSIPRPDPRYV
jgi:signal transduction histidine kinase